MLAGDTNLVLKFALTRSRKLSSRTSDLVHPFKQRVARGSPCVSHLTGVRWQTGSQKPCKKTVAILSMDANCQMTWVANVFFNVLWKMLDVSAFTMTKRGIYLVCARLRFFAPDCAFLRPMLRPEFGKEFWIFQQFGPEFGNQYVSELALL